MLNGWLSFAHHILHNARCVMATEIQINVQVVIFRYSSSQGLLWDLWTKTWTNTCYISSKIYKTNRKACRIMF